VDAAIDLVAAGVAAAEVASGTKAVAVAAVSR
jgi:hypothetical protein